MLFGVGYHGATLKVLPVLMCYAPQYLPVYRLFYEDIADSESRERTVTDIQRFLGLNIERNLGATIQKITIQNDNNSYDSFIENYAEVEAAFRDAPLLHSMLLNPL